MGKQVKLVASPSSPGMEVVEWLVMKLHVPYSDSSVTVQINPSIDDYTESADQPGLEVRQLTVSSSTDETRTLSFDLQANRRQAVAIAGRSYDIELLDITKENIDGQEVRCFTFDVNAK